MNENKTFLVFRTVNSNAHNPRYGRDCHAQAEPYGVLLAPSASEARQRAKELGWTYNPSLGQYQYLFGKAVEVMTE